MLHLLVRGLFLSLFILFTSQQSVPSQTLSVMEPDSLYLEGVRHLKEGNARSASQLLEQANLGYSKVQDTDSLALSMLAQSQAFQAQGKVVRACNIVAQVLKLDQLVCRRTSSASVLEPSLSSQLTRLSADNTTVKGLILLGSTLLKMGDLNSSGTILQRASELSASPTIDQFERETVMLVQANGERLSVQRLRDQARITPGTVQRDKLQRRATQSAQQAFKTYQQLSEVAASSVAIRAQLNMLKLYQALSDWNLEGLKADSNIEQLYKSKQALIATLVKSLNELDYESLPSIDGVYGRLNAVKQGMALQASNESVHPLHILASAALQQATLLKSIRAQSFAWGYLGQLYSRNAQDTEAMTAYQRALSLAQSVKSWDSAYQWQWKLAQLQAERGQRKDAIEYYRSAIESLQEVREDYLAVDSELQFSFSSDIAPVYQDFIKLLLEDPGTSSLDLVLNTYRQFQSAELENFLRCGRIDSVDLADLQNAPPTVFVLTVADRYEVILRKPDGTYIRHQPQAEVVTSAIVNTQNYLDDIQNISQDELSSVVPFGQLLYDQLLRPLQKHLPSDGTIVFVLDSQLQGIPLALLHDGQEFLIESYSLSQLLKDQLRQPRLLKPRELRTVVAGLSTISPSMDKAQLDPPLSALPEVKEEASQVKTLSRTAKQLLNQKFTRDNLKEAIARGYPILHIASHGKYSSDPNRTVLYAWDETIDAEDLRGMVSERADFSGNSIELLVLSACETATGDKRSVLGLAGLTVQAGARSTLASLWSVDSESTALLMTRFYQGLKSGQTKAEALRLAQHYLKNETQYKHPYYWSGFILVGSWL